MDLDGKIDCITISGRLNSKYLQIIVVSNLHLTRYKSNPIIRNARGHGIRSDN